MTNAEKKAEVEKVWNFIKQKFNEKVKQLNLTSTDETDVSPEVVQDAKDMAENVDTM